MQPEAIYICTAESGWPWLTGGHREWDMDRLWMFNWRWWADVCLKMAVIDKTTDGDCRWRTQTRLKIRRLGNHKSWQKTRSEYVYNKSLLRQQRTLCYWKATPVDGSDKKEKKKSSKRKMYTVHISSMHIISDVYPLTLGYIGSVDARYFHWCNSTIVAGAWVPSKPILYIYRERGIGIMNWSAYTFEMSTGLGDLTRSDDVPIIDRVKMCI